MSQVDFFATRTDVEDFVRDGLLKNDALFLPDQAFASKDVALRSDIGEFRRSVSETRRFFFCASPNIELVLEPYSSGSKKGQFFIPPRWGGPFLQLTCPPEFSEDGKTIIGAGSILLYPSFHSTSTKAPVPAPRNLKDLFKHATGLLRARSASTTPPGLLVCSGAARRAIAGEVILRAGEKVYSVGASAGRVVH